MADLLLEIDRALDNNDLAGAAAAAERALATGRRDPLVINLVAWRREEDEQFDEAEALLREALGSAPGDPTLHVGLGSVLRKQGKLKDAVLSFERAIGLDPAYATAWRERGVTFERGGALGDAADDFRKAVSLDPNDASAHASLAWVAAKRGEQDVATAHAERALALMPGNPVAGNALAQMHNEAGRHDAAIALLEPVVAAHGNDAELLISAATLLGDAYEGIGRYEDAFAAYSRSQQQFHTLHKSRLEAERGGATEYAANIGASLALADPALWRGDGGPGPAGTTHVFLTGYPRSGTTLVENILATLPAAVAIEERPTLAEVDRRFLSQPHGVERLAALPDAELDELRAAYWATAATAAGQGLDGKLFIDMDPFKGARLPAIARLFPQAKVIVMRRDPRDVVWSCFHTSFAFNAGTMAFSSLESTARHYAATWSVIDEALAKLPIDHFDLSYAKLVQEFDATTQELCAFLGVPWSAELRRFDRTAEARGVSTASATQVRKGLYDGRGGWRRYARQLAAVEPILAPWIERFEALDR